MPLLSPKPFILNWPMLSVFFLSFLIRFPLSVSPLPFHPLRNPIFRPTSLKPTTHTHSP
jgi:hypothetical protein